MLLNAKTITFSMLGILAAAGGLYVGMPDKVTAPENHTSSTETVATTKAKAPQKASNQPNIAGIKSEGATTNVAGQAVTVEQSTIQVPKKLTKAQLTPPPTTAEEKLQMAAQQESNF